jgi:hypothetical protein
MNILKICGVTASIMLATSCVSTSDLDAVRMLAEQAQAEAQAANTTAGEAKAIAQQAMQMSQATDERINRMFQRSMLK